MSPVYLAEMNSNLQVSFLVCLGVLWPFIFYYHFVSHYNGGTSHTSAGWAVSLLKLFRQFHSGSVRGHWPALPTDKPDAGPVLAQRWAAVQS